MAVLLIPTLALMMIQSLALGMTTMIRSLRSGIESPWYVALGNHDVLHVGGFGLIDSTLRDAAQGDHLFTGSNFSKIWGGYVAGDTADHKVILMPALRRQPTLTACHSTRPSYCKRFTMREVRLLVMALA